MQKSFAIRTTLILLLCVSCRKPVSPAFVLSFDSTLQSSLGSGTLHPASAQYSSYLKRKALYLVAGERLEYDVRTLKLTEGTAEFWIKVDSLPKGSSVTVLQLLAAESRRKLEIAIKRKGIQVVYKGKVYHSSWQMPRRDWLFVAVSWNDSVHLYFNGEEVRLDGASSSRVEENVQAERLRIGFPPLRESTDIAAYKLRDVGLYDSVQDGGRIRAVYRKGKPEEKLVWRAADLRHFAGIKVRDAEAAGGEAWTSDPQMALFEGLHLPGAGEYELLWRIKPQGKITPGVIQCEVWSQRANGSRQVLGKVTNQPGELASIGQYRDLSITFQTQNDAIISYEMRSFMPVRHTFLLDTVTLRARNGVWQDRRRGEDLKHTQGVWQKDVKAAGEKAWGNSNTLAYGPYTCIGAPGKYRATWRVKLGPSVPPATTVLLLDVYAHDGFVSPNRRSQKNYGALALNSDHLAPNVWQQASIEFEYDGADLLELRAFAKYLQRESILLDTVTVEHLNP